MKNTYCLVTWAVALFYTLLPNYSYGFVRAEVAGKSGIFLSWPTRTITYYVNSKGSKDLPLQETLGGIKRAFFSWAGPACTDITFLYGGLQTITRTNLMLSENEKPDGKNLIIWRKEWPPQGVPDGIVTNDMPAITTVRYTEEKGSIFDADLDLNDAYFSWTSGDEGKNKITDVENILAHEIGHMLGLAHSKDLNATMYGTTHEGEIDKRTLDADDIKGLCYIYPFSQGSPPGPGQNNDPPTVQGGCQMVPTHSPSSGNLALFLIFVAGICLWKRCRGRESA